MSAALFAAPLPAAPGRAAGTLALKLSVPWRGNDVVCPAGYSSTTACHPHTGGPVAVPGLGFVSESYITALEQEPGPACPNGFFKVLASSGRLVVKDRGELFLDLSAGRCAEGGSVDVLNVPQTFTVTGGSGVFAGASGSGAVTRSATGLGVHGFGTDNWDGTVVAAGFEQDLTAPTISGAVNKVVRAPRRARTVRVRYKVTATDDVDGAVGVKCVPASGSRFKAGRRTLVRCSAVDRSANSASARFFVTVRRSTR